MNEEINYWLDSDGNYQAGIALYAIYGTSKNLLRILSIGGATRKNQETLIYELSKLAKTTKAKGEAIIKKDVQHQARRPASKVEVTTQRVNTPEVDKLKEHIRDLLKVRDSIQATMSMLTTEKKRKDAAFKILDLSEEIQGEYDRLAHYDKHGMLPSVPVKEESKKNSELTREDLIKKQYVIRTYVSRYKGLLARSKDPVKIQNNKQFLAKYEAEQKEIEKLLKK
jgi:hypothetical protein